MSHVIRLADLYVGFEGIDSVLIRSHSRGIVLRAPAFAVGVLAMCSEPISAEDVARVLGAPGRRLFEVLKTAGVLVDPEEPPPVVIPHSLYGQLDLARDRAPASAVWRSYAQALACVAGGARVVVFGGTLGILPVIAARAGAVCVEVIDNTACLDAVELIAIANDVRDRVRLVEGEPGTVELETAADVAVTAEIGPLGLPARFSQWCRRHLRPGGVEIPHAVRRYVAPVDAPEAIGSIVQAFEGHGVELGPLREAALGRLRSQSLPGASMGDWVEAGARAGVTVGRSGLALGLEIDLGNGVRIDTRAADAGSAWGPSWLPARLETETEATLVFDEGRVEMSSRDAGSRTWLCSP